MTVEELLSGLQRALNHGVSPESEVTIRIDDKSFGFEGILIERVDIAVTLKRNGHMVSPVEIIATMP
jgi:hypothetical protein